MRSKQSYWAASILLCIQLVAVWLLWFPKSSENRMLPILTPVSLKYEKMGRSGKSALNLHQVLERISSIPPSTDPTQQVVLQDLLTDRERLLELRNQRHQLNVSLMTQGMNLLAVLTEEQWLWVQSQRDTVRADIEAAQVDQILERWSIQ